MCILLHVRVVQNSILDPPLIPCMSGMEDTAKRSVQEVQEQEQELGRHFSRCGVDNLSIEAIDCVKHGQEDALRLNLNLNTFFFWIHHA